MRTKHWPENWQLSIIQLLAVPGILASFYLWLYHTGDLINVCSGSGWDDCGNVSGPNASYSSVGPIPVALIGLIGYAVIFLIIWLADWLPQLDDYLPEIMVGLTGVAFLFSLALTGLEIFVINAVCRYCVLSAVIATVMFALSINYLRGLSQPHSADSGG